ncbi:MAG: DUF481 domain-containing protein [Blastomonas sp.]|nr:DUF481 domain-containing protein [Blastomonas sp.]
MLFRSALTSALVLSACVAHSAVAQTPDAVARLIDAALQSGDAAGLDVVVRYAKQAYPQSAESIDAQIAAFRAVNSAAAPAPEATPVVTAAQQAKTEQAKFEQAAAIKYSGEGELGAFTTTGNAPGIGLAAGLKLTAEGEDWRLGLLGRADYQETSNVVVREQYRFSAEPNYKFNERGYVYGLGQYEQDRFQGFHAR